MSPGAAILSSRAATLTPSPWMSPSSTAMTAMGHEDPFPPLWLNVRCVIRHGTFAETNGNGRDAPKAVVEKLAVTV